MEADDDPTIHRLEGTTAHDVRGGLYVKKKDGGRSGSATPARMPSALGLDKLADQMRKDKEKVDREERNRRYRRTDDNDSETPSRSVSDSVRANIAE